MKFSLRPPDDVMRLSVMGAFCQTRLSFMRVLLRRIKKEQWQFKRTVWQMDKSGCGVAVYQATTAGGRDYSLVVYAHNLPAEQRSDRVIATAWDATFTLFDGVPSTTDIARMQKQVPLQETGRNDHQQLVLSRANRSARVFDAVVSALADGRQPTKEIAQNAYLMRTTAVYGNGKFGIADRARISSRPEFAQPFAAEMLAVFMFRQFPPDLAEHLAAARTPTAVKIDADLRRYLGIGNSTGLGMAPFIVNHPILLHRWMAARETALARVRALPDTTPEVQNQFIGFVVKAQMQAKQWRTADSGQQQKINRLQNDLQKLHSHCQTFVAQYPWDAIYQWGEKNLSIDGREALTALLIEPHGELIDDLSAGMGGDETFIIDECSVGDMRNLIQQHYDWIQQTDFSTEEQNARFWYVSAEKQEPRLGERYLQPGAELELPLTIMRDMKSFAEALAQQNDSMSLALFLMKQPQYRRVAHRAQIAACFPYSEIRDNLISADMLPLDLLRCKLSFFGATSFDPRSDRWLRINMFQHAPYPYELAALPADEWAWCADETLIH